MAITRIKNNQITDATITNVKIAGSTLTGDLMNPNLTFNSNLTLNGNLIVTGNVTAVQSTTTQITDPLLTLGLGNGGISYDLGLILIRGSGGNRFIGWKENQGAFVFINTTENGTTTGNIATTAYANVVFGNAITLGSSTFGGITLSANTVSAAGALIVRSDTGTVTIPNAAIISGATTLSSTLSVVGAATVASLTSNAGIIGTTGSFSSNLSASALTVNNTATIGSTLGVTGNATVGNLITLGNVNAGFFLGNGSALTGIAAESSSTAITVSGNAQPNITSVGILTSLTSSGNITTNGLTVNNSVTIGTTLGVTGNINGSGITLSGSLRATGPGDFDGGLQSTSIGNVAPSTALFTTVGSSGNTTVAALTVNGTATIGSTLGITGALTGAAAQFTTINGSGTATVNALAINNAATVGTTLTVGGTATVNALSSNTSISGATLAITGNALVGNLTVLGNLTTVNSQTLIVIDPIIELNTGPNAAPLTVNNGFDSGVKPHYYDTADRSAFFGRKDSSGFFEYFSNVTTETSNVISGTYGTIKSGNLQLVSAATIGTTLVTGGNATLNALTVNNSVTIGTTLGVTGNLAAANMFTTNLNATNGLFTNNVTVAGTLVTTSNITANASGIFFGNAITGNGALFAGVPGFTTLGTNVVVQIAGNVNSYSQINFENINNGNLASTDFIVTADNGNDSAFFGDFGIASSTHSDPAFFGDAGSANDAYLYVVANGTTSGSTSRGNLILGSTNGVVKTFVGNTAQSSVITTHNTTQFVVNVSTASTDSTTGALRVFGGAGIAGAINGGSTLNIAGVATVNSLISNGSISGISINATGNVTAAAVTANGSITAGTTLRAAGGIQNTPIGNGTASTGAFTTLSASGSTTFTDATDSTSPITGAVVITGGLGIGKDLNVTTEANLGNVTINNLTIASKTTNAGLNINPNGTGTTTINSGLNASRTVINGTTANTLVVSGTQVGIGTNTFVSGATLQVNAKDSLLIPVGATGDRPGSLTAGMLRFNTSAGTIEWYNGTLWATPSGDFTVVVANTQTGNGSQTLFTLPVADATTAGTIVSINGVVQQPVTAYSVTSGNVTFTEAPTTTDVIDFRVFTTTVQVTSVTDVFGNTGLFYDVPTVGGAITTFRTSGTESFSIQANSEARFSGNVMPSANITYGLGTNERRWKDLWLSGTTLYLGNIQIKETSTNTISFLRSDGTTPASMTVDISDPSGIQNTPIGNATASTGAFTTVSASGTFTGTAVNAATIGNAGAAITGTLQTAAQTNITSVGTLTGLTLSGNISGTGITLSGSLRATGSGDFDGGLQSTPIGNAAASTGAFTTVSASGTFTGTAVNAATIGNAGAAITGTLQTAAQTNITSVGTLTGLTLSGALNGTAVNAATIGNAGAAITGTLQTAAQTNITSVGILTSLSVSGNVSSATAVADTNTTQLATTAFVIGQASAATPASIGTNTIGTSLRYARADHTHTGVATLTGGGGITVNASTGAVTLGSTATSVNTASAIVARDASGNFSAGTITATLSGAATTAGTVTTAAQTNITSVGTLTGLAVSGSSTLNGTVTLNNILPTANANANIGSASFQFNTIFAKATSAQYADLAENYAADQVYEPGTVVCFGGLEEVTKCTHDMDQRIAGVVSTNPAYIMNAAQVGMSTAVALQGRVPTKVIGKIRKGDMMVSAGDGCARSEANPKIGSVIGKALQDHDGPSGIIEVVVGRL